MESGAKSIKSTRAFKWSFPYIYKCSEVKGKAKADPSIFLERVVYDQYKKQPVGLLPPVQRTYSELGRR